MWRFPRWPKKSRRSLARVPKRDLLLIRVVKLSRPEQFAESVMVQQSAWGLDGLSGAVPAHVMIAAQHHDGLVLGAFDGRKMVGILFGFTALDMAKPAITLTSQESPKNTSLGEW